MNTDDIMDKLLERIESMASGAGFTHNELYLIIKLCVCELKLHAVLSEVSDVTANVDAVNKIMTGAFSHEVGLVKVIVGNVLGDLDVPVCRQRITYQDAKQTLRKLTKLITKYLIAVSTGADDADTDKDVKDLLIEGKDLGTV